MNGEPARRALGGLLARRERWGLTWRGRLTLLLLLLAAGVVFAKTICGFLSVSAKVPARHMVVEGWVSTATMQAAAAEFRSGGYETVYSLGGSTDWDYKSTHLSDTYASVAAGRLAAFGIPRERIRLVPASGVKLDRTFASAAALKKHLEEAGTLPAALNIMTDGVHSRRSRLLFEKAFGGDVAIGVLSTPNEEFDADRWWTTSEGLKEVISETGAWLYARLFFRGGE
jgi:hypothetical protein